VLSKEYKGWSFGRKLVQRLEEVMVQKGISHVYVMAREEDHNLFVSLGYEPEGERIKQEGAYLQKMSKDLFVASA
jgi:N-acetylglutamate synthase-like GNAT family acetyltransferase